MKAEGKASLSGYIAARVLGAASQKIKTIIVRIKVAIATEDSPPTFSAIIVTIATAVKLTKLLPSNIRPISLSGFLRSLSIIIAARLPARTWCLSL